MKNAIAKSLKRRFPSSNRNKKQREKTIVSRALAWHIVENICSREPKSAARWLRAAIIPGIPESSDWHAALRRCAAALYMLDDIEDYRALNHRIFAPGNKKLSFWAFSALPIVTCPGAGACRDFCYSFTAWRYPDALIRQILNTILIRRRRDLIRDAALDLPIWAIVRLYVDGDFENWLQLRFWMKICRLRDDCRFYGYTKSWKIFIDNHDFCWPENYTVNLSSGSIYSDDIGAQLAKIKKSNGAPLVRGKFIAVPINGKGIPRDSARYDHPEYHNRVRESAKQLGFERVFSCPGTCDTCTKTGSHACESEKFVDITIAIGIH